MWARSRQTSNPDLFMFSKWISIKKQTKNTTFQLLRNKNKKLFFIKSKSMYSDGSHSVRLVRISNLLKKQPNAYKNLISIL